MYGVPENEGMEEPLFNPNVQMNSDALAQYATVIRPIGGWCLMSWSALRLLVLTLRRRMGWPATH